MRVEIDGKVFDVGFICDACVAISNGKVVEYFFVDDIDDNEAIRIMMYRIQSKHAKNSEE
jgi:ABC-type sugar transport system ATPase subunit